MASLILREQCEVDRRGLFAILTSKGAEVRRMMWPVYKESVEKHFSTHFTEEEANIAKTSSEKFREFIIKYGKIEVF